MTKTNAKFKATSKKPDSVTCLVKRETLKPAPWNPPIRVQIRGLHSLRDSMEADGFWDFAPILVDKTGTIIDGHRRWTVAGMLHIEDVYVTIVDVDASEMWATYNGTRAQVTGAQMLQAIASGLDFIPENIKTRVDGISDLVGKEGLKLLAEKGVSPNIYGTVRRVAIYCERKDDVDFQRSLLWWLVRHRNSTNIVTRAIRDHIDGDVIVRAVDADKPLSFSWR